MTRVYSRRREWRWHHRSSTCTPPPRGTNASSQGKARSDGVSETGVGLMLLSPCRPLPEICTTPALAFQLPGINDVGFLGLLWLMIGVGPYRIRTRDGEIFLWHPRRGAAEGVVHAPTCPVKIPRRHLLTAQSFRSRMTSLLDSVCSTTPQPPRATRSQLNG